MIRKSVQRFSEKIMREQFAPPSPAPRSESRSAAHADTARMPDGVGDGAEGVKTS
jgi:hypothetical protein